MSRTTTVSCLGLSLTAAFTMSALGCVGDATLEDTEVDNNVAAISCSGYPAWQQGVSYRTGTVVMHNGSPYIAEHDNPGYDPTISTWFWDPYSGCSSGGASSGDGSSGGSCNYPQWQAGASYTAGTVVMYNGSPYIAEHDNPGYDPTISTWFWDPKPGGCGGGTTGGGTTGGGTTGGGTTGGGTTGGGTTGGGTTGGGQGFRAIISEAQLNAMFPSRNPFYTYQALAAAAETFPGFAATGDEATRKREVAAFLANVAHETGNLVHIEEINKADYCDTGWGPPGCGCTPGKQYFGRGPIQLSWNGNYCAAGNALGVDLMHDPDRVARDATVAWRTGLWFWNTQTGAGSMTPHSAITGSGGFGETIRSINGALECGGRRADQVQSRIDAYVRFTNVLGVSPGSNLGC